jgi:hypothetical protein
MSTAQHLVSGHIIWKQNLNGNINLMEADIFRAPHNNRTSPIAISTLSPIGLGSPLRQNREPDWWYLHSVYMNERMFSIK